MSETPSSTRVQRAAWACYDFANSGFGLIMLAVVFAPYFINDLLPVQPALPVDRDGNLMHGVETLGMTLSGSAVVALLASAVALIVAVLAPVLGALADVRGWTKPLFVAMATLGPAVACLAAFTPVFGSYGYLFLAGVYVVSGACFGLSFPFYNAFLPRLVPQDRLGRLSGLGYAAGYIGGAVALLLTAKFLTDEPHLALTFGGVWWLLFSVPAFVWMPDVPAIPRAPGEPRNPFVKVWRTLRELRTYRTLFLFLVAFLLYSNGVETVISLAASYGTEQIGMDEGQLTTMFLVVQGVAFVGALAMGQLADRVGHWPVIVGNLLVWIAVVAVAVWITRPWQFIAGSVVVGLVLGGVQSSSRALMAELAPESIRSEAFGFFAVSGKAMAVLGPLLYAAVATIVAPRFAPLSVLPFLLAGLALLYLVRRSTSTA